MKNLIQITLILLLTIQVYSQNTNCDPPVITDILPISPCLYAGDTMYFENTVDLDEEMIGRCVKHQEKGS